MADPATRKQVWRRHSTSWLGRRLGWTNARLFNTGTAILVVQVIFLSQVAYDPGAAFSYGPIAIHPLIPIILSTLLLTVVAYEAGKASSTQPDSAARSGDERAGVTRGRWKVTAALVVYWLSLLGHVTSGIVLHYSDVIYPLLF